MGKETEVICTSCGSVGPALKVTPGSFLIELLLWLVFLLPGVLYSIYRMMSKKTVCSVCKKDTIIPVDSPKGQELLKKQSKKK